jgi:hypothetical protein
VISHVARTRGLSFNFHGHRARAVTFFRDPVSEFNAVTCLRSPTYRGFCQRFNCLGGLAASFRLVLAKYVDREMLRLINPGTIE